ncbi:uncharacterized protein [Clytia hemisphaerica]|uniref:Cnidarian restricted protein n=1 Tax=Clytia hemisphaerica TaxID=252671 RepID=A0A7M5V1E5_9CNID|eukprot:TCONS_00000837-protein
MTTTNVFAVTFVIFVLILHKTSGNDIARNFFIGPYENNTTCTLDWFNKTLIGKDLGMTTSFFDDYKKLCYEKQHGAKQKACRTGDAYITYAEAQKTSQFYWIFDVFNLNHTKDDCWGMYADIRAGDGQLVDMRYVNFFNPDTDNLAMYTRARKNVHYTFSLYPVPFGDKLQIKVRTPGDCENAALETIYDMLMIIQTSPSNECSGSDSIDFTTRNELATLICRISPDSAKQRRDLILNKVRTRFNKVKGRCEFYLKTDDGNSKPPETPQVNYLTPANISLAAISMVLVVALIIIVIMYFRCKRQEIARVTSVESTNVHLDNVERVTYKVAAEGDYLMVR